MVIKHTSLPVIFFRYNGSNLALHPIPAKGEPQPKLIVDSRSGEEIALGDLVYTRAGFSVRKVPVAPPGNLIFSLVPKEAAVRFQGMPLEIAGDSEKWDAIYTTGFFDDIRAIPPLCPGEYNEESLLILENPESAKSFSGLPVIDPSTGLLVGVTSERYRSSVKPTAVGFEPINDFLRLPVPIQEYASSSFFGIKEGGSAAVVGSKLQGILSPDALNFEMGVTPYRELWDENINCFKSDSKERFGREYLFSSYSTGGWQMMWKWIGGRYHGERVRIDDPRIERFTDYLVKQFGVPNYFGVDGKRDGNHNEIFLLWKMDEYKLFLGIERDHYKNYISIEFQLERGKQLGFLYSNFNLRKVRESNDGLAALEKYFEYLRSLDPEPEGFWR